MDTRFTTMDDGRRHHNNSFAVRQHKADKNG